jgi:hypothetical protein
MKGTPKNPKDLASHAPDPENSWRFLGGYWAAKAKANFGGSPVLW